MSEGNLHNFATYLQYNQMSKYTVNIFAEIALSKFVRSNSRKPTILSHQP